jgi:hypothetical protein
MLTAGLTRLEPHSPVQPETGPIGMMTTPTLLTPLSSHPDPCGRRRGEVPMLLALSLLAAVPVWSFHYFATTDGGAHVANADVLLQYFRPAAQAYRAYYELNHLPVPNGLGHFALALLMAALPPLVAEKVFVTLCLLLLPLGVRYAACSVRRSGGWVAFLAIPLSLNWIFHQGFYNFLISVPIYFFLVGYWVRHRLTITPKRSAVLAGLGLLLYAGHLLSVTLACATIAILATFFTVGQAWSLRKARALRWEAMWPGIRSRIVFTFAGLLPAILLVYWFQHHGFAGKPAAMKLAIRNASFWKDLLGLSILISYRAARERPLAVVLAMGVALLFAGALARKLLERRWHRRDGVLFIPLAFAALYFTRGDAASGQLFIPQRLVFYSYLTALLFIATLPMAWVRRSAIGASVLLVAALTVAHWPSYREYDRQVAEYVDAAARVEPGSTLLPLVWSPRGLPSVPDPQGLRPMPFYTAAGYAAVQRKAVDLRNYEAGLDYFPVRYRPDVNPYAHLGINSPHTKGLEMVPQRVDVADYERQTRGRVDYVLVWAIPDALKDHPDTLATLQQLQDGYEPIYTSPSGRAQLWRRRVPGEGRGGGSVDARFSTQPPP